jgi:hypothetical protein
VIDDHHRAHELRQRRRMHVVPQHTTVPADLTLEVPPLPAWQRQPRRTHPPVLHAYRRRHDTLRAVCNALPVLIPLARWLA